MYRTLNDAASINPIFAEGSKIKVWFVKPDLTRDLCDGVHQAIEYGLHVNINNLEATHTLLGECAGYDQIQAGELVIALQGERWSPHGEACYLIESKDLSHTSFMRGDIIQIDDKFYTLEQYEMVQLKPITQ